MATVFDIAGHIRSRIGDQDRMKVQKLAYYVQAWSLVWREQPAFTERIEAWKDGPVVRALWVSQQHNQSAEVHHAEPLSSELAAHVDRVLLAYQRLSADELSKLTHTEQPWLSARGTTPPGAPSNEEITHDAMMRFYGHRWVEAERDNASAAAPATMCSSLTDFEALLSAH